MEGKLGVLELLLMLLIDFEANSSILPMVTHLSSVDGRWNMLLLYGLDGWDSPVREAT